MCGCGIHGDKSWGRVSALVRVRASIDRVVRKVGVAILEKVQDAFADFFFAFVSAENGVVEAQVERHAPCVSAEVVAFGEPGHRHGIACFDDDIGDGGDVGVGGVQHLLGHRIGNPVAKSLSEEFFNPLVLAELVFADERYEHGLLSWIT